MTVTDTITTVHSISLGNMVVDTTVVASETKMKTSVGLLLRNGWVITPRVIKSGSLCVSIAPITFQSRSIFERERERDCLLDNVAYSGE